MSIIDLIRQQQDQKTETITLRLPSSDLWKIDDLSASLDVTRQRLLVEIIKEGLKKAEDLLEKRSDDADVSEDSNITRYFILNTNKSNDIDTHKNMLNSHVAAAFCKPWKYKIEKLKKGDVVFLYESGTGIVATGKASGAVEKVEYEGELENGYQQKLNDFKRAEPLSAKEIKHAIDSNLMFYTTLLKLPAEWGIKIEKQLKYV